MLCLGTNNHQASEKLAKEALSTLQQVATANQHVFEQLMECVKVCTLGQVTDTLFAVGGQCRRSM